MLNLSALPVELRELARVRRSSRFLARIRKMIVAMMRTMIAMNQSGQTMTVAVLIWASLRYSVVRETFITPRRGMLLTINVMVRLVPGRRVLS